VTAADSTLRLFYGLPLPAPTVAVLKGWQAEHLGQPGVRLSSPEHLHVTLAFLGAQPSSGLEALRASLEEAAAGQLRPTLEVERYRETERVAMLVFADEGGRASALQARLSARLETLGVYRPERRAWLPHVTVARFRSRPRLRPPMPSLGTVTPGEAALYRSTLSRAGAAYEILSTVQLAQSRA
jgi:2'-5' RNA ligase